MQARYIAFTIVMIAFFRSKPTALSATPLHLFEAVVRSGGRRGPRSEA